MSEENGESGGAKAAGKKRRKAADEDQPTTRGYFGYGWRTEGLVFRMHDEDAVDSLRGDRHLRVKEDVWESRWEAWRSSKGVVKVNFGPMVSSSSNGKSGGESLPSAAAASAPIAAPAVRA